MSHSLDDLRDLRRAWLVDDDDDFERPLSAVEAAAVSQALYRVRTELDEIVAAHAVLRQALGEPRDHSRR